MSNNAENTTNISLLSLLKLIAFFSFILLQAKAAKRGSGQVSLKDLGRIDEISKEFEALYKDKPKPSQEDTWLYLRKIHEPMFTSTTLWANSADDKLVVFFLFFPENRIWHCKQIVSIGDNLHEMSNPVFWEKSEKYFYVVCWKFYCEC